MRPLPLTTLCACVLLTAGVSTQSDPQALQRMVATERAFAAATERIGVRDGFLAFFAEDSVAIRRGAQVTLEPAREGLEAQSLPKLPIASPLIWEPYTGHVSADGTLGWLTGAYVSLNVAQQEPVAQGAYFSVWKRQPNGAWRVWLDEGIRLPQIWRDASPFRVAPEPDANTGRGAAESAPEGVEGIDAAERAVAAGGDAWRVRLGADVRLHRDGVMPLVGREAVVAWAAARGPVSYSVVRAEVAGSGDLAITIGAYESSRPQGSERGSWVRAWKKDAGGRWRIVFQTETPAGR